MKPEEIGLLVMKIHNDDVLSSDMRRFITVLMNDEEVRHSAKLVASLSGLDVLQREAYCRANILMLLTASALGPRSSPPGTGWVEMLPKFRSAFNACLSGPWKAHFSPQDLNGPITSMEFQRKARVSMQGIGLLVSETLVGHIRVLEEFWGVRGLFAP